VLPGPTSTAGSTQTPGATATQPAGVEPLGRVEAPKELEVGRSGSLTVYLYASGIDSSESDTPDVQIAIGTLEPEGTPGPLITWKGEGYVTKAYAELGAAGWTTSPAHDEPPRVQNISEGGNHWHWSIRSDSPGEQIITVILWVHWMKEGETSEPEDVWTVDIPIKVTEPFIAFGTLQVATVLCGLVGSGLSLPLLWRFSRDQLHIERSQITIVEEQKMTTIQFGDNAHIVDSNIASTIQDSYNRVENSGVNSDLKEDLKDYIKAVTEMTQKLDATGKEEAAASLDVLTGQATSQKPDGDFIKIAIEKIEKIANTVVDVGPTVIGIGKKLLTLLALL
jgi:hypothetical protein